MEMRVDRNMGDTYQHMPQRCQRSGPPLLPGSAACASHSSNYTLLFVAWTSGQVTRVLLFQGIQSFQTHWLAGIFNILAPSQWLVGDSSPVLFTSEEREEEVTDSTEQCLTPDWSPDKLHQA
ncbi:hypothetical protein UY3_04294 [Chelonia mydas]|uniref:Uncharacterized protein n=1 Tax=Chelonia mydas TaxID=8469 RepID=M7BMP6_CHEMY|nr:hypothetical protein UY3_04294 [Chelonia mydas]